MRQGWMLELLGECWASWRASSRRCCGTGVGRKARVEWRVVTRLVRVELRSLGVERVPLVAGRVPFVWVVGSDIVEEVRL
jgi:hypothetical protein